MIVPILPVLTTLTAALFAGAALYISAVEHPARLACLPATALAQWRPSYRRATVMQASLAVLGLAFGIAAWLDGAGWVWLIAGVVLGSVVPYTLITMLPLNRRLLDPELDPAQAPVRDLLTEWGRRHLLRTGLGLLALLIMLVALALSGPE